MIRSRILVAVLVLPFLVLQVQASSSKGRPGQFDIVCPTNARLVKAHNPELLGYVSYNGPHSYFSVQRFSFDLNRKVYRKHGWASGLKDPINFDPKSNRVSWREDGGFGQYDLRARRYFSRQAAGAYLDEIEMADCRVVGYSGV